MYNDMGPGCCKQDSSSNTSVPLFQGSGVNSKGDCQAKCDGNDDCMAYSYGWDASTWCSTFSKCPELDSRGSSSNSRPCGSSGADGVRSYEKVPQMDKVRAYTGTGCQGESHNMDVFTCFSAGKSFSSFGNKDGCVNQNPCEAGNWLNSGSLIHDAVSGIDAITSAFVAQQGRTQEADAAQREKTRAAYVPPTATTTDSSSSSTATYPVVAVGSSSYRSERENRVAVLGLIAVVLGCIGAYVLFSDRGGHVKAATPNPGATM